MFLYLGKQRKKQANKQTNIILILFYTKGDQKLKKKPQPEILKLSFERNYEIVKIFLLNYMIYSPFGCRSERSCLRCLDMTPQTERGQTQQLLNTWKPYCSHGTTIIPELWSQDCFQLLFSNCFSCSGTRCGVKVGETNELNFLECM